MTIMFNRRFVGPILIGKKIHTIRANYEFWKRHEGKVCSFRVWTGKPYRSPQEEFYRCRIGVQEITLEHPPLRVIFSMPHIPHENFVMPLWFIKALAENDGFGEQPNQFLDWFAYRPAGKYAVLHFTDFRY